MKRRGELIKVADLFQKYKLNIRAPQQSVIDEMVIVVLEITGISLNPERCQYNVSTRTFATNAPSLIRQEIARKQGEILIHAKGRLGDQNAPERIL